MTEKNVLAGLIELIEKRYQLMVVDSQYVKVDDKYDIYNLMLEVKLPEAMAVKFHEKYDMQDSAMHVSWSWYQDKIRFHAEIGNNILLLLDSVK
jgi:hypothetical protein